MTSRTTGAVGHASARGRTRWSVRSFPCPFVRHVGGGYASFVIAGGHAFTIEQRRAQEVAAAYDVATGRELWTNSWEALFEESMGGEGPRATPTWHEGQLYGLGATGEFRALDPWKTQNEVNASQPIFIAPNRVFLSTGYGMGAAMFELSRGAEQDFTVRELWRTNRMKNRFTSSVLHDGFIYGLDESILACIDASTGDLKWKGGRYGYSQVMLALVRATPERHVELARFPAIEGKTWNHPAMSDGYLLIRNLNEMAAFDLRRQD